MVKVHGMSASGNCHKVRMVLEALKLPYAWHEVHDARRCDAHGGVPGDESERPGAGGGGRARRVPAGIQRDHVLPRRWIAAAAQRPAEAGARHAVAVLRAIQPRALHRGGAFSPPPAPGPRVAARARRLAHGRWLSRAGRHGKTPRARAVFRRRSLHHRRYRALRVHACGAGRRVRPRTVSRPSARGSRGSRRNPATCDGRTA